MDRKILVELKEFKSKVNRDFQIDKLVLFGSRSTNKYRKDSDVDLIIVSSKFKKLNFFKRAAKMYDYWNLEYPVDFLCYTPEEYKKRLKDVTIVSFAEKKGVAI